MWWYLHFTFTYFVFGRDDWVPSFEIFSLVNSSSCKFYFQCHFSLNFSPRNSISNKTIWKGTKLCIFTLCKSPFEIEHLRMWNKNPSETYLNFRQIFGITLSLCLCFIILTWMLKGGLLNINDRYKNEICPQRVFAAYRMAPAKPNSRRYNLDKKKNAQK